MAILCSDIHALVQTYLDRELEEHELHEFEQHMEECGGCRADVAREEKLHTELRARLQAPPASELLLRRITQSLNDEDQLQEQARRRARWSWVLPGGASVAAAAALLFFVTAGGPGATRETVAEEAVRTHVRPLPIEVQGAQAEPWVRAHFMSGAQLPRFGAGSVDFVGARLGHLRGHDTAQLSYVVERDRRRHKMTVHILDGDRLDLRSKTRRVVAGREIWVEDKLGYSIVTFIDGDGMAYVFTSDLRSSALIDLVSNSDLPGRFSEQLERR